jgi:AraC-like DNA-binding protein
MILRTLNEVVDSSLFKSKKSRITFSKVKNDFHLENYDAPTYSIKYVLKGTEHYRIDNRKFPVSTGHFLIVNKNQPIDIWIKSKKEVIGLCIHIDREILQKVYTELASSENWLLDNACDKSVPDFEQILYANGDDELSSYLSFLVSVLDTNALTVPFEEEEVFYNLSYNLLKLQNCFPLKSQKLGVLYNGTKKELLRRLDIAKKIIENSETSAIDVDSIAQEAMLSSTHLFRSFKAAYGISPYQYFLSIKMRKAAGVLKTKKFSITEVASKYGFSDLPSFSKAFKKIHGIPPKEFLR